MWVMAWSSGVRGGAGNADAAAQAAAPAEGSGGTEEGQGAGHRRRGPQLDPARVAIDADKLPGTDQARGCDPQVTQGFIVVRSRRVDRITIKVELWNSKSL